MCSIAPGSAGRLRAVLRFEGGRRTRGLFAVGIFALGAFGAFDVYAFDGGGPRAEAQRVLPAMRTSSGVAAAVSRIQFVGEQKWSAGQVTQMLSRETDAEARRNLTEGLAGLGVKESEPTMLALAKDKDATVRMFAAQGLGRIETKQGATLVALLSDKNLGVRRQAAESLGRTGEAKWGSALLKAAKAEEDPSARGVMLHSIGRIGALSETQGLEAFLTNGSEMTRYAAATALCLLNAPTGVAFAQKLLAAPGRFNKRQGIMLFDGTALTTAEPALKPMLEQPDPTLSALAARVLHGAGSKGMLEWLVVRSHRALGAEKITYERELEVLMVTDEQRAQILRAKGLAK